MGSVRPVGNTGVVTLQLQRAIRFAAALYEAAPENPAVPDDPEVPIFKKFHQTFFSLALSIEYAAQVWTSRCLFLRFN